VGLLLGGPLISFAGELRVGAFVVLAGAAASVLRRYTDWSTPGTVVVGSLGALLVAALLSPPVPAEEQRGAEDARRAYAGALGAQDPDILVEPRGPSLVTIWFTLPREMTGACGDYPPAETRRHLADLGFVRVVVGERNASGGLCSFAP
jgi:hypothetical protein